MEKTRRNGTLWKFFFFYPSVCLLVSILGRIDDFLFQFHPVILKIQAPSTASTPGTSRSPRRRTTQPCEFIVLLLVLFSHCILAICIHHLKVGCCLLISYLLPHKHQRGRRDGVSDQEQLLCVRSDISRNL